MRLPIIGQTFAHSASEAVLRAALAATGQAVEIERWERKPHQLADAIEELRGPDFIGALIGAPHKERTAGLLNSLSDDARLTGAVNLVARDGARLRGHNSDVDGVRAGLAALLPKVTGRWPRQAMVLGAGGGARAVVAVLISSGFQRIAVFNRHLHRAEALVADFARHSKHMELRAQPWHETFIGSELAKARLLVNASGIGAEADEMPIPAELLPAELYLLDLVLHAESTPLMAEVQARGGTVANGQSAFLAGSAVTYRLLTGAEAPAEEMRAALAAELGAPEEGAPVVGD